MKTKASRCPQLLKASKVEVRMEEVWPGWGDGKLEGGAQLDIRGQNRPQHLLLSLKNKIMN